MMKKKSFVMHEKKMKMKARREKICKIRHKENRRKQNMGYVDGRMKLK